MTAELAITAKLMKPPERLQTKSGDPFTVLALLCDNLAKLDGEQQPAWVRTTAFGDIAADAAELQKGDAIFAKGSPTLDRWTDKATGIEKAGLSMVAAELVKLGTDARPNQPKPPVKRKLTEADLPYGLPPPPAYQEVISIKRDCPRRECWQAPIQRDDSWRERGDRIDDVL